MRKYITFILSFMATIAYAGPHTVQRGETLADIAMLYSVPLDSIIKSNPNTEAYAGLTIEVPISTLVY
ncbi:MAG: LysM domain-containing protein, partial [Prevotellaceae bacterium]|nr:LysM domain-containing protein [Prevotellaceae bacterium]